MEQYLAFDVNPFPSTEVDVKQVFMEPDNAEESIMVMEIRLEPRPGHENTDATVASLAYPIFLEDAGLRMGFPFPFVPRGDGCPVVEGFSTHEAIEGVPPAEQ